jgi:type I restriction enzyme, R subunit
LGQGLSVSATRARALAERYFHDDANTCLIKLRQFGELLAQLIAAKTGLFQTGDKSQADLLRRLRFERLLPSEVADLFHEIRMLGNRATHGAGGTPSEALNALKYARQVGTPCPPLSVKSPSSSTS